MDAKNDQTLMEEARSRFWQRIHFLWVLFEDLRLRFNDKFPKGPIYCSIDIFLASVCCILLIPLTVHSSMEPASRS